MCIYIIIGIWHINGTMENYVLTLRWTRCPEGARLLEPAAGEPGATLSTGTAAKNFRIGYRSTEREEYRRRLETPDELVVTSFLNAAPDASVEVDPSAPLAWADKFFRPVVDFVSKYGLPYESEFGDPGEMDVLSINNARQALKGILDLHAGGNTTDAVADFQCLTSMRMSGLQPRIEMRGERPALMLPINSLFGFMLMETALIITGGFAVLRCAHCGKVFVTGSGTGRRKSSKWCSNRCRVAAQRARK
jgi:hypothetical protein